MFSPHENSANCRARRSRSKIARQSTCQHSISAHRWFAGKRAIHGKLQVASIRVMVCISRSIAPDPRVSPAIGCQIDGGSASHGNRGPDNDGVKSRGAGNTHAIAALRRRHRRAKCAAAPKSSVPQGIKQTTNVVHRFCQFVGHPPQRRHTASEVASAYGAPCSVTAANPCLRASAAPRRMSAAVATNPA